jgi:hypothetical protein
MGDKNNRLAVPRLSIVEYPLFELFGAAFDSGGWMNRGYFHRIACAIQGLIDPSKRRPTHFSEANSAAA